MTDTCTCQPGQLDDPAAVLRAAAARTTFTSGRSYVVATDLDGAVSAVRSLPRAIEVVTDPWLIARSFIGPAASRMLGSAVVVPPRSVLHLVRCRTTRAVWGLHDLDFAYGLLYGLNLVSAFCGEVVIVTPYGWTTGGLNGAASPTLAELRSS